MKDSYYNKFNWNINVCIFDENIKKISTDEADIYGFGFNNFYMQNSELDKIKIENSNKINILLTHGALDASSKDDMQYNPMSKNKIKELGFDYVALGHIHKPYYNEEQGQNIVYPGSTISLGFDELGKHGLIFGSFNEDKKLQISFVQIDSSEFVEKEVDISSILSKEELIEVLNKLEVLEHEYCKIILTGKREFEIDVYEILREVMNKNVIKIKNNTSLKVDLDELARENSLKGIFVRNMLDKIDENNKEEIMEAIEIGLLAM